ncbi:hypothetical protein HMPREF0731_2160 [Pseudoroseomonas cervicalis ATCC 49957]|uniref:Uncharacterized protein n=1 Tax=Pseudoroseomonas cervicalis ATCC 49957 TaxID=525371 RepID=D5RM49_9PROT|nr:hypothetical protein HMPREF0731_2160 [Pseudoroseomonas cervicalis ATCC 49957]
MDQTQLFTADSCLSDRRFDIFAVGMCAEFGHACLFGKSRCARPAFLSNFGLVNTNNLPSSKPTGKRKTAEQIGMRAENA